MSLLWEQVTECVVESSSTDTQPPMYIWDVAVFVDKMCDKAILGPRFEYVLERLLKVDDRESPEDRVVSILSTVLTGVVHVSVYPTTVFLKVTGNLLPKSFPYLGFPLTSARDFCALR